MSRNSRRTKSKSKSNKPSLLNRATSAVVNYGKNVAGGAGIVAGAVAGAVKNVTQNVARSGGGKSQTGAVLNATTLPGAKLNPQGTVPVASGALGSRLATAGVGSQARASQVPGKIVADTAINKKTAVNQSGFDPILDAGNIQNAEIGAGATGASGYEQTQKVLGASTTASNRNQTATSFSDTANLISAPFASNLSPSLSSQATAGSFINSPGIKQSAPGTSVITASALTGQNPLLNVPPPPPAEDLTPIIPAPIPTATPEQLAETKAKEDAQQDLLKYLERGQESEAKLYEKAQRQSGILESQKLVGELTAQLNEIVNRGQAQQLQLVGQGRGIPEAIIGGQQAEIGRQTAIAALPVQAQLSAAQGNLEMAERNLETLYKIYSNDAKNKYERKLAVKKAVYEFATEKEKKVLEKQDEAERRALKLQDELLSEKKNLAMKATENGASAATISKIMEAPDFNTALKAAGNSLKSVSYQKLANGDTVVVDGQGKVISNLGGSTPTGVVVPRTVNGTSVESYTMATGGAIDDPYNIAQRYGISVDQLKALNPQIKDWYNIQIGTSLNVPSKNTARDQALNTILASGKFTKDQKADLINGINGGQDPLTVAKNQAKNIMGQTNATKLDALETAQSTLMDLGDNLQAFYDAGGDTGLLKGNFEKIINNLGQVRDPALVALATQIQGNIQVYRNAISGTAYSEQEGRDIASIFPGINKSETLNNAILRGRQTLFDSTIDAMYSNVLGKDTYDALKQLDTPPVDPYQAIVEYGNRFPEDRAIIIQMQNDGVSLEGIYQWLLQQ